MSRVNPEAHLAGPLLSFEAVGKRYPDGRAEIVVLRDASFEVFAGDLVGIMGGRRAGKSTLLRLAAGIELPDAGTVRFAGRDTAAMSTLERARLLRGEIGLVCAEGWRASHRERVVDLIAMPLLSSGATLQEARRLARRALDAVGAAGHADELAIKLSTGERMRVLLARALVHGPRIVLVDEPAAMPSLEERDAFYELLRAVASERGAALLIASDDTAPLRGGALQMSIGDGELICTTGEPATVVPFPERAGARTGHAGT